MNMKKKLSIFATLLFALSLLVLVPAKVEAANPSSKVTVVTMGALERSRARAVVKLVNEEREAKNLKPLVMTDELETIAVQRAVELSAYPEHDRPNGEECFNVLDDFEFDCSLAGENIAMGFKTSTSVMDAWMESPGHKANILNPEFTHIGVACFEMDSVRYWVQFFVADPPSETPAETNVTNGYEIVWPYEVDTNFIKGCSLEFEQKSTTLYLGEKKEFDLVLYDPDGYFLGVVYSDELDVANGGLVIEGSDILSVKENYFVVGQQGKTGTAKVTVNVGTLSATKTIKIDCKHKGETTVETKESTCKENGYEKTSCNDCGSVISTKTLDKVPHEFEGSAVTKAGFDKAGSISGTCKVCEEAVDVAIPAVQKPTLTKTSFTYTGKAVEVVATLKDTTGKKLEASDYTIKYDGECILPGTHTATIVLTGDYEGEEVLTFKILPPMNGKLVAKLYGHDDVKLTWDKVDVATGYNVYYKKDSNSKYTLYKKTTKNSIDIPNLSDNTKYDFRVYSYYEDDKETYVSTERVDAEYATIKYMAEPEKTAAVLTGYNDVKITWNKVKNVDKYRVYYKKGTSTKYKLLKEVTKTEYKISNISDGTKYTFKIVPAYYNTNHGANVEGFCPAEVSIYTLKKMISPNIQMVSPTEVEVTWEKVQGASGYQISRSTSKTATNIITTTSRTSKLYTPAHNVSYFYKVRPYKTVAGKKIYGPWSEVEGYRFFNVGKASNVKAVLDGDYDDIKISWSKATNANSYMVYSKSSANSKYQLLGETSKLYLKKKNFKDGVKYTFKVVPVFREKSGDLAAEGKSATASVTTLQQLDAPVIKKSTSGKVKVTWVNIAGETGYQISKSTSKTGTSIVSTVATTSGKEKIVTATAKKTYYYKVRAYKTVNGVKIYSPWSEVVKFVR